MPVKNILYYLSNQHNLLIRTVIFITFIAVIVSVLPKEGRFRFTYVLGHSWEHADLRAPFNFGIRKTEDELQNDRDEIRSNSKRYFRIYEALGRERIAAFLSDADSVASTLTPSAQDTKSMGLLFNPFQKNRIVACIDSIYNEGFVSESEFSSNPNGVLLKWTRDGIKEQSLQSALRKKQVMQRLARELYGKPEWASAPLNDYFEQLLVPNISFDADRTERVIEKKILQIAPVRGLIATGELIIREGEMVSPEKFKILNSLQHEYESKLGALRISHTWLIVGQTLSVTLILVMLFVFLIQLRKELFEDSIRLSLLAMLMAGTVLICAQNIREGWVHYYAIPYCILPIVLRSFFDTRLALFAHLLTTLILGMIVPNAFEFCVIQILGGMSVIFSVEHLRRRSRLFAVIALLTLVYLSAFSGFSLMMDGNPKSINLKDVIALATGAALSLFSYPIIYAIERVFGYTSDVSLLELSDTNSPLLRELSLKAPGTFYHSLQVANLAEAAIGIIGGNSLLVRTGALYHDIGKMEAARYFIENQSTGVNPHEDLDFEESAQLIISHVSAGLAMGRRHKVPEAVLDFIRTHHGTSRVQYFYRSFLNNYPDEEVNEAAFRYKGPIPFSRETAVVMMADAVEATSRSMRELNSDKINKLVEDSINRQVEDNQFLNADITFKDITRIKRLFKKMLMNMYHVRAEYPG
jgi:hypothetical protein